MQSELYDLPRRHYGMLIKLEKHNAVSHLPIFPEKAKMSLERHQKHMVRYLNDQNQVFRLIQEQQAKKWENGCDKESILEIKTDNQQIIKMSLEKHQKHMVRYLNDQNQVFRLIQQQQAKKWEDISDIKHDTKNIKLDKKNILEKLEKHNVVSHLPTLPEKAKVIPKKENLILRVMKSIVAFSESLNDTLPAKFLKTLLNLVAKLLMIVGLEIFMCFVVMGFCKSSVCEKNDLMVLRHSKNPYNDVGNLDSSVCFAFMYWLLRAHIGLKHSVK